MRKPSEYIAAAVRNIRDKQMTDCACTLTHGENSAKVTRVGTFKQSGDEMTGDGPTESIRVLALASDFPDIDRGAAVELDDTFRVVTSVSKDPTQTSLSVFMSAPFEKTPATYSGKRRDTGSVRQLWFPVDTLYIENGVADNFTNAVAPTYATGYTLAIRREDWQDATDPEVADAVEIAPNGYAIPLKVSAVTRHDGWYILNCRTRD